MSSKLQKIFSLFILAALCVLGFFTFKSKDASAVDSGTTHRKDVQIAAPVRVPASQPIAPTTNSNFDSLEPQVRASLRLPVFNDKFELTAEAIEFLKLSDKQIVAIRKASADFMEAIRAYEVKNAEVIKEVDNTSYVYIPASGEAGQSNWTSFEGDLQNIAGKDKAEFLLKNSQYIFDIYSGYHGTLPKLIEVRPTTETEGGFKFYIREMVLRQPSPPSDFVDSDSLYSAGLIANQRSEYFNNIPDRYASYVTKGK